MSQADLVVVGSGPAGYGAALRASRRGLRAVLVEERELGGVCLNRGCIPSKAMLHTAGLLRRLRALDGTGVTVASVAVDLAQVVASREQTVARLRSGVSGLLASAGVEVVRGRGRLTEDGVSVEGPDGERALEAGHVLLATGSSAARPPFPGADLPGVVDSDGALALTEIPQRAVVVGGGAVGCEWAEILAGFGARVTLLEAEATLLPLEDPSLGQGLAQALGRQGIDVRTGTGLQAIEAGAGALGVVAGGESIAADVVLLALGRRPQTADLGLERRGLAPDERGFLAVDDTLATGVPGVSAAGDVTGKLSLAHVATHQAAVVVDRLAGLDVRADYTTVPSVTYTHPEVASVGDSPSRALAEGREVATSRFPLAALGRAVAAGEAEGFVQLVSEPPFNRIVGAQILAPHAGELIAEVALAIGLEATLDDLVATVHAHPTFGEATFEAGLVGLGLAAHVAPARRPATATGRA